MILQTDATTGNGTVVFLGANKAPFTFYVEWHSACTAGQVTLETARASGFAGTWAPLAVVDFVANTTAIHVTEYPLAYVRARISSDVTGTSAVVNVTVEAQGVVR